MPNNDYKKGFKTESRNLYTSDVLSKLSIKCFNTLAVKQNEHNCKRDPIYSEYDKKVYTILEIISFHYERRQIGLTITHKRTFTCGDQNNSKQHAE
jgi:hypothetical protein